MKTQFIIILVAFTSVRVVGQIKEVTCSDASLVISKPSPQEIDLKIKDKAITTAKINSASSLNGEVLTSDGAGGSAWKAVPALKLPFTSAASYPGFALSISNSGPIGAGA